MLIVKISIFPIIVLMIYTFKAIPIKIPVRFLKNIVKLTLKFIQKGIDPRTAKTTLRGEGSGRNHSTQY